MREIKRLIEVIVPAGSYVLGDPCYVVPDDKWDELLLSCDYFQESPIGKVDGYHVLGFSTQFGDGLYMDNTNREYPVDAGLIGLVPLEFAQIEASKFFPTHVVTFDKETLCTRKANGVLTFGSYSIDTDPEEESDCLGRYLED